MKHCTVSLAILAVLAGLAFATSAAGQSSAPARTRPRPLTKRSARHDVSPPLRAIPPQPRKPGELREIPLHRPPKAKPGPGGKVPTLDRALQMVAPAAAAPMPSPILNFEGIYNRNGVLPPDTNGDIGPHHYVQIVNLSFAVYDRSGNRLLGPLNTNTLWSGFGGPCQNQNDGDPIVLYDQLADRWLVSQFAVFAADGNHQCIAISQTGDPTGSYYRYDFLISATKLNDYPKFGVWPDGYYMSVNQFNVPGFAWAGAGVVAFERDKMLQGLPASMVYFDLYDVNPNFGSLLPTDLDGPLPPPSGSPDYFIEMDDDAWGWPSDELQVFQFHVDWNNPANSTFTGPQVIDLTAAGLSFDSNLCGYSRNCIPQPSGTPVDAISDRLMYRLAYRNFGDHESLVVNHTVDVDGSDHAGIRWYEIRNPGGSPPTLFQAGTFAPDSDHRWMGSIAMDGQGNIALGYSVSSTATYPSIRYAGRLAGDPLGTLPQAETTLIAGSGSQSSGYARWGDYSMMAVDPLDDCTFWYTQEYYVYDTNASWHTRVGSFRFPGCTPVGGGLLQGSVTDAVTGAPIKSVFVKAGGFGGVTDENGHYAIAFPPGSYDLTTTVRGYYPATAAGVVITSGGTTVQDFTLSPVPRVTVRGTVRDGSGHGWPLYARIVADVDNSHPAFTNPVTGEYSLQLFDGEAAKMTISSVIPGYWRDIRTITASVGETEDFSLSAYLDLQSEACLAPGYQWSDAMLACIPLPGGLVVGNVLDATTGLGLNGAGVGGAMLTIATPEDDALPDGFYYAFYAEGTQSLTASKYLYGSDTHEVTVVADAVVQQDFRLTSGSLSASPGAIEITLPQGGTADTAIALENTGSGPANFQVLVRGASGAGGNTPATSGVPHDDPGEGNQQPAANLPSLPADKPPFPHASPQPAQVDRKVLRSWVASPAPWGIAVADSGNVWVSSPAPNWGGQNKLDERTPDGVPTTRSYPYTWRNVNGPADGAFNWNTGRVWVMDVGKDNCIHEIDPAAGITGNRICPGFSVSQRGVAYDPTSDTWYIGGWNEGVIHHVDSAGTILESVYVGLWISGLAYNPDTRHLFVMENWGGPVTPEIIVLDSGNGFAQVERFHYAGISLSGAGLEMGCDGTLWAVDQASRTVYQFESGETTSVCVAAGVPWLTVAPQSGALPAGATQPLQVHLDASQPGLNIAGTYQALLRITSNTPQEKIVVPVTMHVTGDPNAPVAAADSYIADIGPGATLTVTAPGVLANDSDPNGDTLTAVLVKAPSHGTLQLAADGSFTYTPRSDAVQDVDSFTYQANDGRLGSNLVSVTIQYAHPLPVLDSVTPQSLLVEHEGWYIYLQGSGFFDGSVVRWNGVPHPSRLISSTLLELQTTWEDVLDSGYVEITVANPAPGGGVSNPVTFTVLAYLPVIQEIIPSVVPPGTGDLILEVQSYCIIRWDIWSCDYTFVSSSKVRWNGADRPTTYVDPWTLRASIPASDVAQIGTADITVFTPTPGGGTSNVLQFSVVPVVPVPGNDNLADAFTIPSLPFTDKLDTRTATSDPTDPPFCAGINPAQHSVWYRYTSASSMLLRANMFGSDYPAEVDVYNGPPSAQTYVTCAGLAWAPPRNEAWVYASAGTTYYFRVSDHGGGAPGPPGGHLQFNLSDHWDPEVFGITPGHALVGSPSFTLAVKGNFFKPSAVVRWNGNNRATTGNSTDLSATILASDIAHSGVAEVAVVNPDGSTSGAATFATFDQIRQFGSSADDGGVAVGTDATGLYVVGNAGPLPGQNVPGPFVRKYDAAGNEAWTHQVNGLEAMGGVVDSSGVYMAGATVGHNDAFLRKYDADGNLLWHRTFGGPYYEEEVSVALDATGIYVAGITGWSDMYAGDWNIFLYKFDAAGNQLWMRQFGTISVYEYVAGVAANSTGVYVAGYTYGIFPGQPYAGGTDVFLRKYDREGNELWTREFGTTGNDRSTGVVADDSGVYLKGLLGGSSFLRKYDATGNELWTRQTDVGWNCALTLANTQLYVPCGDGVFVLDRDGNQLSRLPLGVSSSAVGVAFGLGGIYIMGNTNAAFATQTNAGGSDVFLVKFNSPSVSLTSPNGGEVWRAGTTHTISWTYTADPGSPLTINLLKGGVQQAELASVPLDSGGSTSYSWTIPADQLTGSDYRIQIVSPGGTYADTSDADFTVQPPNHPPLAADDPYATSEDTPLSISAAGVLGNDTDADGDLLTAALVTGPAHGILALAADGSFTYTPAANFHGTDSFTYRAYDGAAYSSAATVTLTINSVNDPPVATNDSYVTNEDVPITASAPGVLANDTDVDNDPLTAILVSGPTHGTLSLAADGSFTYTPAANFHGSDTFTYRTNDGSVDSNLATVSLTINSVNDPPVSAADSYATDEDTPLSISAAGVLGNDSDADGDLLTAALVTGPAHGILALAADGSFTYTPAADFHGTDSFTYRAYDGLAYSNVATVTLTINPVNDPPQAADDSYAAQKGSTLTVPAPGLLANDTDVDGDPFTAVLGTGPAHGTLTLNSDGSFTYTPGAGFFGRDSFTYRANDGAADSNLATVNLHVRPNSPGDFDGDGMADILWHNSATGGVAAWLMNGVTKTSAGVVDNAAGLNWKCVGVGDFDGDGKADILRQNSSTGDVVAWLMDGTSRTSAGVVATGVDPNWKAVGVGDFDGDGMADILWQNSATGGVVVWLMNGATKTSAGLVASGVDSNWKIVGTGDFDGDGMADILWQNSSTGGVVVWLMNGAAKTSAAFVATGVDPNWKAAGTGDFDGDGMADILWQNSASGGVVVWLMNGASKTSGAFVATGVDPNWKAAEVRDFDGDGRTDILWQNSSTGGVVVWLMNGASKTSAAFVATGVDPDWKVVKP